MKGYKYWEFSNSQLSCDRVTLFTAYTLINQYVPGKTLGLRGVIVHFARNSGQQPDWSVYHNALVTVSQELCAQYKEGENYEYL